MTVTPAATRLAGYRGGVPEYRYVPDPAAPAIALVRLPPGPGVEERLGRHSHDFPALAYLADGELLVVPPGTVVEPGAGRLGHAEGAVVFFTPEALDRVRPEPTGSWRVHPLLVPFGGGTAHRTLRLQVPEDRRAGWAERLAELERELTERPEGYRQAAAAHLVLLLVETARLAAALVDRGSPGDERWLTEVFAVVDQGYPGRLSLRDVARAVNLTPGHLTTKVRARTGRTVQEWITDRRMTEARRLLEETTLPVGEVARRVGYPDPGYFGRVFHRLNGMPPRRWRAGGTAGAAGLEHGT